MPDQDNRIVELLEQLVELQKTAADRQQQILKISQERFADARTTAETSVDLQRLAIARQRLFLRVWFGLIAVLVLGIVWLVYSAFHRFH